MQSYSYN
ncbi:uncharacterized protein FFB20_15702 [Fusarium fujikuroi]|nr:uncharacterized protein FFB20_15702 [Fusarium fujikuroi]SCO24797.1 uncharacterized protein FFE2_16068 [Fusarium fujikuroi]